MFFETRRRSWFSPKYAYNLIIHKRKMPLRRPELSHTFLLFDSVSGGGSRRSCRQLTCCVKCVFGRGWLAFGLGRLGEQGHLESSLHPQRGGTSKTLSHHLLLCKALRGQQKGVMVLTPGGFVEHLPAVCNSLARTELCYLAITGTHNGNVDNTSKALNAK